MVVRSTHNLHLLLVLVLRFAKMDRSSYGFVAATGSTKFLLFMMYLHIACACNCILASYATLC
jgi:hypothetical protein